MLCLFIKFNLINIHLYLLPYYIADILKLFYIRKKRDLVSISSNTSLSLIYSLILLASHNLMQYSHVFVQEMIKLNSCNLFCLKLPVKCGNGIWNKKKILILFNLPFVFIFNLTVSKRILLYNDL